METVKVSRITELRAYTKVDKIKFRNNAVEASALDIDYEVVVSKIQAGDCYEVMNFRTVKIKGQYKVMPHNTQLIFTVKTMFRKLSALFPPIPRHRCDWPCNCGTASGTKTNKSNNSAEV
ncbi:unnamed protein product [Malus baccata var. baccata]